jgi:predicted DNA-binding transcriptional regulator AlpA
VIAAALAATERRTLPRPPKIYEVAATKRRTTPLRVLNIVEVARRADLSKRTVDDLIAKGLGPTIVKLTERRVGVIEQDFERWVRSRRQPARGKAVKKATEKIDAE